MCSQAASVPSASPPSPVRFVVFELTRQEDRDENLVDGPLDSDHAYQPENRMRSVPCLKEPL